MSPQTTSISPINIGISEKERHDMAEGLSRLLADTYMLFLKTHYFHWNVTGPMFQPLHSVFETQYQELFASVDELAERIRALGYPAPGTFQAFSRLSSITEEPTTPDALQMIRLLVEGHEVIIRASREAIDLATRINDLGTADLLTQKLEAHEKTTWMLRSFMG